MSDPLLGLSEADLARLRGLDGVVNCAGLWAAQLLSPLGIEVDVKPTRHQMCFFRRPREFGVHPALADMVQVTYMRPEHGDLTIHGKLTYNEIVDPDNWNEGADADQIVKNAELIAREGGKPLKWAKVEATRAVSGKQPGDPARAAIAMISAFESGEPPLRLLLGASALKIACERLDALRANFDEWAETTISADFPS